MSTTRRGFFGLLAGVVAALKLGPSKALPAAPPLPTFTGHGIRGIVDDGTEMAVVVGMEPVQRWNGKRFVETEQKVTWVRP